MKDQGQAGAGIPRWVHWAVTITLTLVVAALDVFKPGDRGFSIFYLAPTLYVGCTVLGRAVLVLNGLIVITVFLAPWIGAPEELSPGGIRNRIVGVGIGAFMAYALWDRRRSAAALERANNVLETRVAERTAELQRANRSLSEETEVRQKAEEDLRQAQKMEAIGLLAAGIAHDFNNLLTVINGYANLLRETLPQNSSWREGLEQIAAAGERATDVTHKLLAFGRRQVLQPTVLNLNDVLAGMEKLIGRLLPENITLVIHLDPALQPIEADRNELERALLNFAANARDAMPDGGEFRLATSQVLLTPAQIGTAPGRRPGPHVRLTAADTGRGMDATTRQRIFEPFFTTKEIGKGTGLGLASVYGVIRQSGGNIEVISEIGRGTTFTIHLPCVKEAAQSRPSPDPLGKVPVNGAETILLVEDDASVRNLTETILRKAGYKVLTACDGRMAAELAARHSAPIHLVITDLVMPQLSGVELAALVARDRPGVKVLFVTGYSLGESLRGSADGAKIPVLAKPYTPESLTLKVGALLHSAAPSSRAVLEQRSRSSR